LPTPKIRKRKILFDLKPESQRAYEELEEELETVVRGVKVSTPLVLTLTMKLQQLAGGFLIQDIHIPGKKRKKRLIISVGEEKLEELAKLLPTLGDRKLVICARFRHELEKIAELVEPSHSYKMIAGGHEYNGLFDTDIILLQVQSGVAIDLSMSNSYIFYSWDFSYINFEQSKFRVLSFDTEQVNYYFLMARGTVDEEIYEAVVKKKDLATLVCDRVRKERRHVKRTTRKKNRGNQGRAKAAYS
jgi:hypothetical protein